ncbi:MAG TPA: tRNA (adenosine(37)-N6)-threonylcarbamoyltransferase complex dimerization subunit type 1 TsaB [Thermoanaerobaculia bacterium]
MIVLGLESATAQVGVAIGGPGGVIVSFHSTRERRHAEALAPAIDFLCRQAGVDLDAIGAVAVDVGPGLFTGLRVGLATGKAIAHALSVPMAGVSSLDLLAFPARITERVVVSAIDARRGEVYHAGYRKEGGGIRRIAEPRVGHPDELAGQLRALGEGCLMVGDGAHRYAEIFGEVDGVEIAYEGFRYPSAESLVELAVAKARRGELVPEREIMPLYLRESYVHEKKREA